MEGLGIFVVFLPFFWAPSCRVVPVYPSSPVSMDEHSKSSVCIVPNESSDNYSIDSIKDPP